MTARQAARAVPRPLAAAIAGLLVLLAGAAARAQVHAYGTAAKVNGVGISNESLERGFQEYMRENNVNIASVRNPERAKAMRREALDLLIDQELAWQAARKENFLATAAEVDEAMRAMRAKFRSEQGFAGKLSIEGYTEASYREHLRRLVSGRKYLDRIAASAPGVGDEEIHAFYTANPEKFAMPERGPKVLAPEGAVREQVRSYLQGVKIREAVQAELRRLRSAANIELFLPE